MIRILAIMPLLTLSLQSQAFQRIVSLSGTTSEILCALGLEKQIVAVDITSNYPTTLNIKPKVGHNRNISAEGILAVRPDLVLGLEGGLKPQVAEQLASAGIKVILFKHELSVAGVQKLTTAIGAQTGTLSVAKKINDDFSRRMRSIAVAKKDKKVLFIYARGAGTMLVSGTNTPIAKMIELSGARNAVSEFSDYKPLTPESLIAADPDVILLFSSGLESLNGSAGLLKVPGVAQTRAGKTQKIISMDGELLSGFSLRLPDAIKELNSKI